MQNKFKLVGPKLHLGIEFTDDLIHQFEHGLFDPRNFIGPDNGISVNRQHEIILSAMGL